MAGRWANVAFLALSLSALLSAGAAEEVQVNSKAAIVADVELVQIPVIVFDEKGAVVTDLQKNDFRVAEDGVEQRLLYCDSERESVSFVIVDDISQSMTRKIQFVREATASVLNSLPSSDRYQDEYSLFSVESRVMQLVSFTKDSQSIERRLPGLLVPTDGGTALFDGLYSGVLAANQEAKNKRRAVIIISDGGDNHSRHNLRQTKKFLEEAGVPVFAVMAGPQFELLAPPLEKKPKGYTFPIPIPVPDADVIGSAERQGPGNLQTLTEVTGGGVFTAHDSESLARITRTISVAVRYQYVLSYQPQGTEEITRQNNWHKIHLELIPTDRFKGYSIYYKRGFYRNEERVVLGSGMK